MCPADGWVVAGAEGSGDVWGEAWANGDARRWQLGGGNSQAGRGPAVAKEEGAGCGGGQDQLAVAGNSMGGARG